MHDKCLGRVETVFLPPYRFWRSTVQFVVNSRASTTRTARVLESRGAPARGRRRRGEQYDADRYLRPRATVRRGRMGSRAETTRKIVERLA